MSAVVAFHRFATWGDDFRAANAEPSPVFVAPVAIDCVGMNRDRETGKKDGKSDFFDESSHDCHHYFLDLTAILAAYTPLSYFPPRTRSCLQNARRHVLLSSTNII